MSPRPLSTATMPPSLDRASVLGLPVHLCSDYGDWLVDRLERGAGVHIATINAEMAMAAGRDRQLRSSILQADLVVPDGAGVVLYLRARRYGIDRVPGIELAETLLERMAGRDDWPVLFFGGRPEIVTAAADRWRQRCPNLAIAGVQHGYLNDDELAAFEQEIAAMQPRAIFVALGVPRQEYWIAAKRHLCPQAIWIGVGGSFDIWSGTKERAPDWFCRNNLEWLYRLYQEPWRWRRMLALPHFAWRAFLDWLRPAPIG